MVSLDHASEMIPLTSKKNWKFWILVSAMILLYTIRLDHVFEIDNPLSIILSPKSQYHSWPKFLIYLSHKNAYGNGENNFKYILMLQFRMCGSEIPHISQSQKWKW